MEMPKGKSLLFAYFLWLFGGIFGAHHFYLNRDNHGIVWATTLGGFIIGWLTEITCIPRYVRNYNEHETRKRYLATKMASTKKPPFSINRFSMAIFVGYVWGQLILSAIPINEVFGYNLRILNVFAPLAIAAGVWTVGNIGNEKGDFAAPLLGAYAFYPSIYFLYDDTLWVVLMAAMSALAFDIFTKQWRPEREKHSLRRRVSVVLLCIGLYSALWLSYLYFNGTVTNSEGEEIPISEAIHNLYTSSWWMELKQCVNEIYMYTQHYGWYELWKQLLEMSYQIEEQNAYQVLGVGPTASQQQITAAWRALSRNHHPDKIKDETLKRKAQDQFMAIQQAYEALSKAKRNRRRRNKQIEL